MATKGNENDIILEINVKYDDAIKDIAKYTQEIENLREQSKGLKNENKELVKQNKNLESQWKKGEITLQKFNQETRLNTDSIEANNEAVANNNVGIQTRSDKIRILRQEIQNNIKIEDEYEESIISIQAQIKKLNREYEHMGDTLEREAKGKEILALQNELNDLNEARGRFQGQVGNYRNAILETIGINNKFTQSLFEMSRTSQTGQGSIKSFFDNTSKSVTAFGKTLLGLLSNPVFMVLAGIAGVGIVFKFWYDYNKGIQEATKLTKDFTGLSGNELKAFRNEVQGIASTFDKDFKEVLESANALSKQFGISQQEALSLVKDGFIAGADANGQFLDMLKEYPAFFKEAGISASEFVAVVADTNKQGIFSDKGIDAIKEANIRIREMGTSTASALDGIGLSSTQIQKDLQAGTITTFEVMQKVSEKLNEFPDQSQQVGKAVADIFGSAGEDAGVQYIKTLKDIETNLDEVKKKSGELGEIQERQMNANIELQNAVSALFDQTGGTFEMMIGKAKVFATETLTSVIRKLIDVINWFIKMYNDVLLFRAVIIGLKTGVLNLFEVFKALFNYVINTARIAGNVLYSAFNLDIDGMRAAYAEWGKNTLDIVKDTAKGMVDNAKEAIDQIQNSKIKPIEIPVTTVPETSGSTPNKNGGTKAGITDAMKKAAEDERKAAMELARFRLETEVKNNKAIADDQEKSYDERIAALNRYQNLQRAYIEKDKEFQLKEKGLTESQKILIQEKANQKLIELEKELGDSAVKILQEDEKRQSDILKTNIDNRLAIVKQGSQDELDLKIQQLTLQRQLEIDEAEKTGADKAAINAKYRKLEQDERQKQIDYNNEQVQKEFQNQILVAQQNKQNTLQLEIAAKQAEIDSLKQLDTESDIDFMNRKLTLQGELKQLETDYFDYQVSLRTQSMQALSVIAGGLEQLFSSVAEDNEAFASFAKAMALYQIGLDTATALTAGIAASQQAGPFPANLIAIATTVATVLANIAKAKKYLSSEKQPKAPKFASGGFVSGQGSGTSDNVQAWLSNGESVLNAHATAMFSPVLSAFNQIGGGVPISTQDASAQIMGEEMLTRSFARAVQSLPNPVVSVEEINSVNERVKALETGRSL